MKIVITGPESTGKSRLTKAVAQHFDVPYAEEFARLYLEQTQGKYAKEDLLEIAKGQIALEDQVKTDSPDLVICDTSLEVIRIWSEWKYKACDPYIHDKSFERKPDLFLLLKPDIPWMPDSLRENPNDQEMLSSVYKQTLLEYNTKTVEIGDYWEARLHHAIKEITSLIST